jgi:L-threonylcarbamoyladenylate synthase
MSRPFVATVDPRVPDPDALREPARRLREGGLVAFPTETVYGLGADATNEAAVRAIFAAKGRPPTNPLIVHVDSVERAKALTRAWPPAADLLAARFWPGPLTLVLPKAPHVPDVVTAGLDSVGVRIPAHPVALALLRLAGVPVAAPSANRYTSVSPTLAKHVLDGLGGAVDAVVDGGPCSVGIESTVVSLVSDPPRLLRLGRVSRAEIEAVVALAPEDPGVVTGPALSPGMAARHYAPRARVTLVPEGSPPGKADARVIRGPSPGEQRDGERTIVVLPADPHGYAAGLYGALHRVDEIGARAVEIELPPDEPAWAAVRDRLRRAATP